MTPKTPQSGIIPRVEDDVTGREKRTSPTAEMIQDQISADALELAKEIKSARSMTAEDIVAALQKRGLLRDSIQEGVHLGLNFMIQEFSALSRKIQEFSIESHTHQDGITQLLHMLVDGIADITRDLRLQEGVSEKAEIIGGLDILSFYYQDVNELINSDIQRTYKEIIVACAQLTKKYREEESPIGVARMRVTDPEHDIENSIAPYGEGVEYQYETFYQGEKSDTTKLFNMGLMLSEPKHKSEGNMELHRVAKDMIATCLLQVLTVIAHREKIHVLFRSK